MGFFNKSDGGEIFLFLFWSKRAVKTETRHLVVWLFQKKKKKAKEKRLLYSIIERNILIASFTQHMKNTPKFFYREPVVNISRIADSLFS